MKTLLLVLFSILYLSSCTSTPETRVSTSEPGASLSITGAPEGSQLLMDGKLIGLSKSYDGHPNVLTVPPGTHQIQIREQNGNLLYDKKNYFSSELREISVGAKE